MKNLTIERSNKTPYCSLNSSGQIELSGISMPEDAAGFYFRIMDWISDYYRTPSKETSIKIALRYLNSTSSSMMMRIFTTLKRLQETGKTNIHCIWYYEADDQDMKEYIEEVARQANNIDFKLLPTDGIPD
jgi:hypothetical protein